MTPNNSFIKATSTKINNKMNIARARIKTGITAIKLAFVLYRTLKLSLCFTIQNKMNSP